MREVAQTDFTRAARGSAVTAGADPGIEPVLMGISSVARTAVRKVHRSSSAAAIAYYTASVAKYAGGYAEPATRAYRTSLDRYIAWDASAGQSMRPDGIDRRMIVPFGPADAVRAICHVAVDDGAGGTEARIVLWDELRVDVRSAEMIALPVLEAADAEYGAGSTTTISVWQLAQNQRLSVLPASAQARRAEIQALLATL